MNKEEKEANKERERIRKCLRKEIRYALKRDNSFTGVRNAIMAHVVNETIGTDVAYQAILKKVEEGTDGKTLVLECMEKTVDFMLWHLDIIVKEMGDALLNIEKNNKEIPETIN